jgi:hypothetical protein
MSTISPPSDEALVPCPNCKKLLDPKAKVCLSCGTATKPVTPEAQSDPAPVYSVVTRRRVPDAASPHQREAEPPPRRESEPPIGRSSPPAGTAGSGTGPSNKHSILEGKDRLVARAEKEGYELIGMVGLSRHGKSEFLYSFVQMLKRLRGGSLTDVDSLLKQDVRGTEIQRTDPGAYFEWPVPIGDRLFMVWDIAGEDFEKVASARTFSKDVSDFLCRVLPHCRGLILTISLPRLWAAWNNKAGTAATEVDTRLLKTNVDAYIRFLEFAQVAQTLKRKGGVTDTSYLTDDRVREVLKHAPLLDIPIVINLSMADVCVTTRTPKVPAPLDRALGGLGILPSVSCDPNKVDPFVLAYLYLEPLFKHLEKHVRWFKFDFSHAYESGDIDKRDDLRVPRGCQSMHMFLNEMNWGSRLVPLGRYFRWSTGRYFRWYRRLRPGAWAGRLKQVVTQ